MTDRIAATQQQLAGYATNKEVVNALAPVAPARFQFFAGFDGTWNNRYDPALSGSPQPTNVDQLEKLVNQAKGQGDESKYYEGIGSQGTLSRFVGGGPLPEYEAGVTANRAYKDVTDWANARYKELKAANPTMEADELKELLDI